MGIRSTTTGRDTTRSLADFRVLSRWMQNRVDALLTRFIDQKIRRLQKIHPQILEPLREIKRSLRGGKRLRPALVAIGYLAGGGKNINKIIPAAAAVELVHLFALIHDDIIDRSPLRRFQPTTVEFFKRQFKDEHLGLSCALLAGDLAVALADELFSKAKVEPPVLNQASGLYRRLKEEVLLGQYLDVKIPAQKSVQQKDLESIITYKTAKYSFERPLHIGAALAGGSKGLMAALSRFALPLGRAFQIQDDILGVFGKESEIGKPVGSDIREGKVTLLTLTALAKATPRDKQTLRRVLGNGKATAADLEIVKQIFIRTGAYEQSQREAHVLMAESEKALTQVNLPRQVKILLSGLVEYLGGRV